MYVVIESVYPKTLFLFFGKGQIQASFINMSATFKRLDYILKIR